MQTPPVQEPPQGSHRRLALRRSYDLALRRAHSLPTRLAIRALLLIFTNLSHAGAQDTNQWRELFDGKTLANWTVTNFGGEGIVEIKEGRILLGFGSDLTGITWKGPSIPRIDYEVKIEARREEGGDFFCGLTF